MQIIYVLYTYRTLSVRMFGIVLNENILKFLKAIKNEENGSEVEQIIEQKYVSIMTLKEFYKENNAETKTSLRDLLSPLTFKYKETKVPGANYTNQFKQRLEYLKLKQDEDMYQDMIKKSNLRTSDEDWVSPAQMNKQIKEQITTVFNIIVSVLSVVVAIWYWTNSSMNTSPQYRILLCLFFGILVLIAEVVVYNSYLRKIDEAKDKEKAIEEKKKVIKKMVI